MSVQEPFILYPNCDNAVYWGPLATGATAEDASPTLVTDATGTLTVYDKYGRAIAGATNISFAPTGTSGVYKAAIAKESFNPKPGRYYNTRITMSSAALNGAGETWNVKTWVEDQGPR
ncbi:MAG TPA: hypothetical protein VH022_14425 [Candidatus Acidoferrum sp.]|jgi:hypothetical protein|nr:hypothetical protein [Candidatus Acidoferrum sp.]